MNYDVCWEFADVPSETSLYLYQIIRRYVNILVLILSRKDKVNVLLVTGY